MWKLVACPPAMRRFLLGKSLACLWGALLLACASANPAFGQRGSTFALGRSVPTRTYFAAFQDLADGEYKRALRTFNREGRGAIKSGTTPWIDSICYLTMQGECYYQTGQYAAALERYQAALEVYLMHSDWMSRLKFTQAVQARGAMAAIVTPWGRSQSAALAGRYPEVVLTQQGRIDNERQIRRGGVVQSAVQFPIVAQEIARCTALAMLRRWEIMGPVAPHHDLSNDLITKLSRRKGVPNHWSSAWIDVQLGMAYAGAGKHGQAVDALSRGVTTSTGMYHPLTPLAQIALGRLAMQSGNPDAAAVWFEEASYASFLFLESTDTTPLITLEEAFRWGAQNHLLRGIPGPYPPLATATGWAKQKRYGQLYASMLISAAEYTATSVGATKAMTLLNQATAAMRGSEMALGWMGPRWNYLQGWALFQQGKIDAGREAFQQAFTQQQRTSFWLYQLGLADRLYVQGRITDRTALSLYQETLNHPADGDWLTDPLESYSMLLTPHPGPLEHWFEVALARKDLDKAFSISDRARQHRFFSTLPLGGRLLSMRWLVGAPATALNGEARQRREGLFTRYPAFREYSRQADVLMQELRELPVLPEEEEAEQQSRILQQLASLGSGVDATLHQLALRREPSGYAFPPVLPLEQIQRRLPDGTAVLAFFAAGGHMHAFLIGQDQQINWLVSAPANLQGRIAQLLRELGHHDANRELGLDDLESEKWKELAEYLREQIFSGPSLPIDDSIDELVIVPDGALWYLPFELLPSDGEESETLGDHLHIRYAPTLSLAVPDDRRVANVPRRVALLGKLYPRDKEEVSEQAAGRLLENLPDTATVRASVPRPARVWQTSLDQLLVWKDIPPAHGGIYSWSPLPTESRQRTTLAELFSLPWGSPSVMVLPGFHSAAENSLRRMPNEGVGNDLFLALCGCMATGSRTVLISRWRPGGRASYDLTQQFMENLRNDSPAASWQKAVQAIREQELVLEEEPRVNRSADGHQLTREHPFFWAGYLLADRGLTIDAPETKRELPALEEKKSP